jgi:hypothetical protein
VPGKGWRIALAIILASAAAGLSLGAEFAVAWIWPNAEPAGPSPVAGYWLFLLVVGVAIPAWAVGLTVLGVPLGMALRRIGRDGYVSAMLAGAVGGFLALLVIAAVFEGTSSPALLLLYSALMLVPGAAAGWVVRRIAYRSV